MSSLKKKKKTTTCGQLQQRWLWVSHLTGEYSKEGHLCAVVVEGGGGRILIVKDKNPSPPPAFSHKTPCPLYSLIQQAAKHEIVQPSVTYSSCHVPPCPFYFCWCLLRGGWERDFADERFNKMELLATAFWKYLAVAKYWPTETLALHPPPPTHLTRGERITRIWNWRPGSRCRAKRKWIFSSFNSPPPFFCFFRNDQSNARKDCSFSFPSFSPNDTVIIKREGNRKKIDFYDDIAAAIWYPFSKGLQSRDNMGSL